MKTGATEQQIGAAVERRWPSELRAKRKDLDYDVELTKARFIQAACYLIPPDHRIIGPEQIAAIGRVLAHVRFFDGRVETCPLVTDADLALLAALVEGS